MSGFFKGFFGTKDGEHDGEMLAQEHEPKAADDQMEQLQAEVQGTVDTELEPAMLDDAGVKPEDDLAIEPPAEVAAAEAAPPATSADSEPPATSPVEPPEMKREFSAEQIWNDAGVSADDQATVARAQALLAGLPNSTPDQVKRQIVEASLKAFDVSLTDIVGGAGNEITALRGYIDKTNEDSKRFVGVSEARIDALEAEIASIRETIEHTEQERDRLVGAATEVIDEVQPVLDFFGPGKAAKKRPPLGSQLPAPASPVVAASKDDDKSS